MTLTLLLIAIAAIAWGIFQTRSLKAAQAKLSEANPDEQKLALIKEETSSAELKLAQIREEIASEEQRLIQAHESLALVSDAAFLIEVGYYEPRYDFEDAPQYESELQRIREKQKAMLREDGTEFNIAAAAYATQSLTFNDSASQGRDAQKKILKLILRAFNGESDSFIARVNYRNMEAMEKRICASFNAINTIAENYYSCGLNERYLDLRLQELRLVHEWEEARQKEKEEQARIREQIREEEKAAREAEKAKQQAEKEEASYQELLQKAEQEVLLASEQDKAKLNAKIEELQQRIGEIEEKKRAISQAMLTKTGHVYIISNIGSFGENIYKIGMTRRLDPMDRVKELGDASVPFPFDVHAMIRTSDAPTLENALHKHFDSRRLNLENQRKEFFQVSMEEIRQELEHLKDELGINSELRLTLVAEAKEYRMSQVRRKHVEDSSQASS